MKSVPKLENRLIKYSEKGLGILVVISGIIAMAGWSFNHQTLASFGEDFIPMAPSTALFFIFSGLLIFFQEALDKNKVFKRSGVIFIIITSIVFAGLLWFSLRSEFFSIETLGFNSKPLANHIPTAHMSPVTALCFLLSNISILILILNPQRSPSKAIYALTSAVILFLITLNLLLAYVVGSPVLYNSVIIPPAMTTSITFILIGSGLIILAGKQLALESIALESYSRKTTLLLIFIFITLATGIVLSGNFYFKGFEKSFEKEISDDLISITDLKIGQIEQWRQERSGDVEILNRDEDFARLVKSYLSSENNEGIKERIENRLRLEQRAYQYDAISIFDENLKVKFSLPEINQQSDSVLLSDISSVFKSHKILFRDFYKSNLNGKIYLQQIVPVPDISRPEQVVAVISLRIDPDRFLYALINKWPIPSQSVESLIVRREGDSVIYLNKPRFANYSALEIKRPIQENDLPAVKAALGVKGIVKGTDYRNVPVLASVNSIQGTPWHLVASVDIKEVYAPLREKLRLTVFLISMLVLSLGISVGLIWRQQNTRFYREQFESADRIRRLNRIYNVLSNINESIVRIRNVSALLDDACSIFVRDGGFGMAWIGLLDKSSGRIEVKSFAGVAEGNFQNFNIDLNDSLDGEGPVAMVLNLNNHVIVNDIQTDSRMEPWRKYALALGYQSSAVFPLTINNKPAGIVNIYSVEKNFFSEEEIKLLDELARDISFALEFANQESERQKAEETIRENEKRFRGTLDTMIEGCQIIGFDWKYLYLNDASAEHGKKDKNELLGRTMMECFPGIESTPMFRELQECMQNRNIRKFENEFLYSDGSRAWFELSIHPVQEGIFILSLDITARKLSQLALIESENILNQAQSVAKVGSWSTNLSDKTLKWSPETYRIFNVPESAELSYEFFISLVYPDDRNMVRKASDDALMGTPYNIEHRIIVNGQVRWVREKAEIGFDSSGKPVRRVGTVQDITERKQTDEKIHLLNAELELRISHRTEQLQEANKELEAFAYSVSHDLRAPLRSIIGYSNILKEDYNDKVDEEGHRIIQTIIKNTIRMGQLIDDLLEFSRMGRKNLSVDNINMDDLVREIASDLTDQEKGRKIETKISTLLPCKADRNMIQQVWVNLISNSLKYTRKRETVRIEIGSSHEEKEIRYFIHDNGVGFDMKYSDKLFGVFQRLHTLDEFEGTGVGLAIVKRIINRHDGKVWAKAEVDNGATLYFTIPE